MNCLTFMPPMPSQLLLDSDGEQTVLSITLEQIVQTLTPYPASDYQWEMAIMHIEDVISPFAKVLIADKQTCVMGADALRVLPHSKTDTGEIVIGAEIIELSFAVIAGLRHRHELPKLPDTVEFASLVLLLREWVHHLAIDDIVLKSSP